ncbi:DUF4112 domain-containing protein [Wenzhouxiangella sp. XN79A]|uniref:DUF4112 domain-containing protein n=1 Tax=Wenzhouxiangella sp. XN79A TaxID=2724193 RepID=UPI00144AA814|nr:DUF4112 domain-containing protein [Wenzhouxiangella sp. XN79A]NKI34742.1 DUF4112 domain-containing protein [Wenzhouxiangella sp. XN79A]
MDPGRPDASIRETLVRLQRLSDLMDRAFPIPGTNIRFGFDSIIGLIPVAGDTVSAAISGYIYTFARKAGVPRRKRMKMVWNIFVDWLIGLVPLVGDMFDIGFKANTRNVRIIMTHFERRMNSEAADADPARAT